VHHRCWMTHHRHESSSGQAAPSSRATSRPPRAKSADHAASSPSCDTATLRSNARSNARNLPASAACQRKKMRRLGFPGKPKSRCHQVDARRFVRAPNICQFLDANRFAHVHLCTTFCNRFASNCKSVAIAGPSQQATINQRHFFGRIKADRLEPFVPLFGSSLFRNCGRPPFGPGSPVGVVQRLIMAAAGSGALAGRQEYKRQWGHETDDDKLGYTKLEEDTGGENLEGNHVIEFECCPAFCGVYRVKITGSRMYVKMRQLDNYKARVLTTGGLFSLLLCLSEHDDCCECLGIYTGIFGRTRAQLAAIRVHITAIYFPYPLAATPNTGPTEVVGRAVLAVFAAGRHAPLAASAVKTTSLMPEFDSSTQESALEFLKMAFRTKTKHILATAMLNGQTELFWREMVEAGYGHVELAQLWYDMCARQRAGSRWEGLLSYIRLRERPGPPLACRDQVAACVVAAFIRCGMPLAPPFRVYTAGTTTSSRRQNCPVLPSVLAPLYVAVRDCPGLVQPLLDLAPQCGLDVNVTGCERALVCAQESSRSSSSSTGSTECGEAGNDMLSDVIKDGMLPDVLEEERLHDIGGDWRRADDFVIVYTPGPPIAYECSLEMFGQLLRRTDSSVVSNGKVYVERGYDQYKWVSTHVLIKSILECADPSACRPDSLDKARMFIAHAQLDGDGADLTGGVAQCGGPASDDAGYLLMGLTRTDLWPSRRYDGALALVDRLGCSMEVPHLEHTASQIRPRLALIQSDLISAMRRIRDYRRAFLRIIAHAFGTLLPSILDTRPLVLAYATTHLRNESHLSNNPLLA
jgi:hypothetical protein